MRGLAIATLLSGVLIAQSATFVEGDAWNDLRVRAFAEASPLATLATVVDGVEFLPIEISNRRPVDALRGDRARIVVRGGIPRIELPGGAKLFKYRRPLVDRWGFLGIHRDGSASVLLEVPGAAGDPFDERVGVAHDGRHATFALVNGPMHIARLDVRVPGRQSWRHSMDEVESSSMCVGTTHVFYQSEGRLWRGSLVDGATPEDITPVGVNESELEEEMAISGDGSTVVFAWGPERQQRLWLARATGPAVLLPPPASEYRPAGYAPDVEQGPYLLLNETGTRLLYIDMAGLEDELYLLDTTTVAQPVHLTSDENFEAYIGISILPSFMADTLVVALGDDNIPNPEASFDWYSATTSGPVVNITKTATTATTPFAWGALEPLTAYRSEGSCILTVEDDGSGNPRFRCVDGLTGGTTVMVPRMRGMPTIGRSFGSTNVTVPNVDGDCLINEQAVMILQGPKGVHLGADSSAPGGGISALVVSLPSGPAAGLLRTSAGGLYVLPPDPSLTQIVFTAGGGLLVNGGTLDYLASPAPVRLPRTGTICSVL